MTGTPSTPAPSTRCSERRACGSSVPRSGRLGRTPSPSAGCARCGPSAWTGRWSGDDPTWSGSFAPTRLTTTRPGRIVGSTSRHPNRRNAICMEAGIRLSHSSRRPRRSDPRVRGGRVMNRVLAPFRSPCDETEFWHLSGSHPRCRIGAGAIPGHGYRDSTGVVFSSTWRTGSGRSGPPIGPASGTSGRGTRR